MHKGPSINDVSNWEVEGSKTGQNCRRIAIKNCRHGGVRCQKSGKIADVVYGWSFKSGGDTNFILVFTPLVIKGWPGCGFFKNLISNVINNIFIII